MRMKKDFLFFKFNFEYFVNHPDFVKFFWNKFEKKTMFLLKF